MSCVYHKLAEYMISLKSTAEAGQRARAGGGAAVHAHHVGLLPGRRRGPPPQRSDRDAVQPRPRLTVGIGSNAVRGTSHCSSAIKMRIYLIFNHIRSCCNIPWRYLARMGPRGRTMPGLMFPLRPGLTWPGLNIGLMPARTTGRTIGRGAPRIAPTLMG